MTKLTNKLLIQIIQQKNLLLALIKSAFLSEQQAALTQLLLNTSCKIRSLREAEKTRKHCWLIKRAKNEFNIKPLRSREKTLEKKKFCFLKFSF